VRLREKIAFADAGQLREFQLLLVRLRVYKSIFDNKRSEISIPSGAIKRFELSVTIRVVTKISIPSGAIKRRIIQDNKTECTFNFNSFWCD